jgi:acid phosphatase
MPSTLPRFVFLTPNTCHDMHDCSIATGNAWLHDHATHLLRRGARVIVVFDEGTDSTGGGGHVYAAIAGAGVPRGVRDRHRYSHRSLLGGLERHFGVPRLHGAKRARPLPI